MLAAQVAYWKRQLDDVPLLELPSDRPRPPVQTHHGGKQVARVAQVTVSALKALSRREGASLFMILLSAFQVLLYRYTGQKDIVVGTPVAGRNRVEIEGLIGFFVNTLVLRADLTGNPSSSELLGRVRGTVLTAHTHQNVPFEKLVQELSPERSLAHAPFFQVMLVLQNAPVESLEIQSLRLRPVSADGTTAKFDLTLSLAQDDGGLLEHAEQDRAGANLEEG